MSSVERGLPGDERVAEAVVQRNDGIFLPFNAVAVAVSMFAFCVCVAVHAQRHLMKFEKENEINKDGASGRKEMTVDGRKM